MTIEDQAFSLPSDLALSPSASPISQLDGPDTEKMRKRNDLLTGGKGEGAKSYDGEKARSSIVHKYSLGHAWDAAAH